MLVEVVLKLLELLVGDRKGVAGIARDGIVPGEMTDGVDSLTDLSCSRCNRSREVRIVSRSSAADGWPDVFAASARLTAGKKTSSSSLRWAVMSVAIFAKRAAISITSGWFAPCTPAIFRA